MFGQQLQSPAVPVAGYGPTQAPAPYAPYYPAQTGMTGIIEMIMPIMMLMLVLAMIMPLVKEMGKGF
jgi:hypothetical protein